MAVTCLWPGSTEPVRVRRNDKGEIVELTKSGEIFVLQHVGDADALKRLFAEQGIAWNAEGVGLSSTHVKSQRVKDGDWVVEALGRDDGPARQRVLLDKHMLEGNFPDDMPESTRKSIGKLLEVYAKAPGVSKKDLRRVRAKLIHETWLNGNQPLDDYAARELLRRFCPALIVCELPAERLQLLEKVWADPNDWFRSWDALASESRLPNPSPELELVEHVLVRRVKEVALATQESLASSDASFGDFLRSSLMREEQPGQSSTLNFAAVNHFYVTPDGRALGSAFGGTTEAFQFVAEPGSAELVKQVDSMWYSFSSAVYRYRPKRPEPVSLWCHTCGGECKCPTGSAALRDLSTWLGDHHLTEVIEHRWSGANRVKPTKRLQQAAKNMTPATESKLSQVLGDDWPTFKDSCGDGIADDVALFLAQVGGGPDDLDEVFVRTVLVQEMTAASERAKTIHANWSKRVQELEELGTSSPKTAVFLGRDGIYGFWAFQELEKLGAVDPDKVQAVYVSASREANYRSLKKLNKLSADGSGEDLVYVDTGFEGSIPRRIAREVFNKSMLAEVTAPRGKKSFMRLESSPREENKFSESLDHATAVKVEHDAKSNMSGMAVVVGKDGGTPTSAMEQLVARQLKRSIQKQTREEAADLQQMGTIRVALTYYTGEYVQFLQERGMGFSEIADAGRSGLSPQEALEAYGYVSAS